MVLLLWIIYVISVLYSLWFCACLFIDALWTPTGKRLTSWLLFVMSNCEVVTFPLVSWVRCGAWLYLFLIFAIFLTLNMIHALNWNRDDPDNMMTPSNLHLHSKSLHVYAKCSKSEARGPRPIKDLYKVLAHACYETMHIKVSPAKALCCTALLTSQTDFSIQSNSVSPGQNVHSLNFVHTVCCRILLKWPYDSLRPSQQFSFMLGWVFLGWTIIKQRLMCFVQGHNAVPTARLEPATPRSWVKYSITEPLRSLKRPADDTQQSLQQMESYKYLWK